MPDVPTIAESGLPGYDAYGWFGVLTQGKTPKDVIAKLNREIVKVVQTLIYASVC